MVDVATADTDKTSEVAMGEGAMVQTPTPPPTKTDRKLGAAVRMVALGGGDKKVINGVEISNPNIFFIKKMGKSVTLGKS